MATWIRESKLVNKIKNLDGTMIFAVGLILIIVIMAVFAPLLAPHDPNYQNLTMRLKAPGFVNPEDGSMYLLGTDQLGRDIFSRIIYGSRVSLFVGIFSVSITAVLGTVLGLFAGFCGGIIDMIIMRIVDLVLSIPSMLLALAVIGAMGPGLRNLIIVIIVTRWARYARTQYGQVLSFSEREFVQAAVATGCSKTRIIFRHLLPNLVSSTIVLATLDLGFVIVFESGLSFLGLGVPPTIPTWGGMLSEGRAYLASAWWLGTFPGIAIMLTVLGFNLLGDSVRDALDPTLKNQ